MSLRPFVLFLSVLALAPQVPLAGQEPPSLRSAAIARRASLRKSLDAGIAIIQSADRSQPNLYEFMVPDTENHDFAYLTGLDASAPPGSVLVLNPRSERFPEVLYTSGDTADARARTGIATVLPYSRFLEDLSSALTDHRNLRITQLRFKPIASEMSRALGDGRKVVWLNYPRFTNLGEPSNPRLALATRLREASPDVEMRDLGDVVDRLRMIHDAHALASLRRAVRITGLGITEAMKGASPGMTTQQVGEVMDFVYRFNGAGLGFPTGVSAGRATSERFATAREEMEARAGSATIRAGDLVHIDTGAEWEHFSADVQRVVPASGTFSPAQRDLYQKVLAVQKAVIAAIRPGVTWNTLHDLAVRMLRDAGGLDESYTYGIGHFIGMEVHDHGFYNEPLQPGMVISIEQGAVVNGVRVAFEDDVLVTTNGHEWLTRFIPIEIDEVERLRREPRAIPDATRLKVP